MFDAVASGGIITNKTLEEAAELIENITNV